MSNVFLRNMANLYLKKVVLRGKVKFGKKTVVGRHVCFEGGNALGDGSLLTGISVMGYGSYIGHNSRFFDTRIGRFCSIGSNVTIVTGRHPSRIYVSTHPAFFSMKKQSGFTFVSRQKYEENKYVNNEKNLLIIGNDVWVGSNVVFLEGVSVGDGAIIAAGAVVNKDVAPYTIVGGNPCKFIRNRFEEEQINALLKMKWWNKDIGWLYKHAEMFEDIDVFLQNIIE